MTYALKVSETEKKMIDQCVAKSGMSAEEFIYNAVVEKLEDMYDLVLFNKAIAEDKEDVCTGYNIEEAGRMLGLR